MQTIQEEEIRPSWLERPLLAGITINWETILFATILILAVVSRFYNLGARVMSHDENTHVVFSWQLFRGMGYFHDPLSHGPFQFHIVALSYFLFGDNDFTARLPHALFSIATVAFAWNYRRYLGRVGAMVAAGMLLISPYILYYGRYARNETFVGLYGLVTLWAILRYLEVGAPRYLYFLTAATIFHFASKETAFIYTAQALLFLGLYLIYRLTRIEWPHPASRNLFLIALILAILLLGAAGASFMANRSAGGLTATETQSPAVPGQTAVPAETGGPEPLAIVLAVLGVAALAAALYFLIRGCTLDVLRMERSFDLLILLGTLVLPMLTPFLLRGLGWPVPTNSAAVNAMTTIDMIRMGILLAIMGLLSVIVGLWWNSRLWLGNAALFYAVFLVLFTTVFTNGAGIFTGLLGSLGYWLEQQGVQRGSQPWYYYALVQVPVYEYLPALGSILAFFYSLRWWSRQPAEEVPEFERATDDPGNDRNDEMIPNTRPVVALLGFWSITSLIAFTIAGEKMPWLTFHITLPMILLAAWAFGRLIESIQWNGFQSRRGLLIVVLLPVFFIGLFTAVGALTGQNPPFQGKELGQLQATSTFITALLAFIASAWALAALTKGWPAAQLGRVILLTVFAFLAVLTARTAITSSYINYDNANELLVYAHAARGQKDVLEQIEEISRRTSGGLSINVAYDNETNYSYWWYLRNYPNKVYYGTEPTRALRDSPVIVVGDNNYSKIEPVVREDYYQFDYIRLWWPNQDYFQFTSSSVASEYRAEWQQNNPGSEPPPLTTAEYLRRIWSKIRPVIVDPQVREAVWQIWLNRDYTEYGRVFNKDMSLTNWSPAARMRMYVRKDIASQLWNYGVGPSEEAVSVDPYQGKQVLLNADRIIGTTGSEPGQFQRPRDLVVAQDGSLYVADTGNHRIQHLDASGNVLAVWGNFADLTQGDAPGGTFYEPWGIALGPDGSVYVADTWNHRIQRFTPEGEFMTMWGYFGQAETADAFWGPRDVAVNDQGQVFVTDTGNKRIAVFDPNGNPITEFGETGLGAGQFDEPVGLTLGPDGQVFVADTWNQRIQSFIADESGNYAPLNAWDVSAWFGQSLDNKPYMAANSQGNLFVTDPEGSRVLEFTSQGEFIRYWGDFSTGPDGFGMAGAVAVDPAGGVWVSDAGNGRVMHFTLP